LMVDYSQQTSIQQLPVWLEDLSKKNMAYAQGVSENAITLPGQQIAGLGGMTQQALNTAQGIGGYMPMLNQAGGTTTQGINALTQGMQGVGSGFTGGMGAMQNAISGLQGAPTGQGYVGQAAGAYGQAGGQYGAAGFDPSSVSKYMNPYEDMAVQQALKDIRREGDVAQTAQQAAGVQAGAFGGSRQGLQSAELAGNIFKEQGRTAAGMRQAGFQNAMQQAMQESQFGRGQSQSAYEQARQRQLAMGQGLAGLGAQQSNMAAQRAQALGQLGTGYAGISAAQAQEASRAAQTLGQLGGQQANIAGMGQNMIGQQAQLQSQFGALQQQQAQRQMDANYQNQMKQLYEPYQRYSWMSDMIKGTPSSMSTVTSATSPSQSIWSQLIGGGIAGLGAYKAFDSWGKD
jgi:hypothetical protein